MLNVTLWNFAHILAELYAPFTTIHFLILLNLLSFKKKSKHSLPSSSGCFHLFGNRFSSEQSSVVLACVSTWTVHSSSRMTECPRLSHCELWPRTPRDLWPMALKDDPVFASIVYYSRCLNCGVVIASGRCGYFLSFPIGGTSPPEASKSLPTLCANELATSNNTFIAVLCADHNYHSISFQLVL